MGRDTEFNGAGVLPVCVDTERVLLGLREGNKKWDLFGGSREKGELPRQTAIREFIEEVGYNDSINTELLCRTVKGEKVYYTFLGVFESEFTPDLNWEHIDWEWFEYKTILSSRERMGKAIISVIENTDSKDAWMR